MRDLEYEAFLERDRRETNTLLARIQDMRERWATAADEPLTPEERLAKFVEILMEEIGKLGTPLPVPVARVGVSGVDRQAQKVLVERGAAPRRPLQAATFDQYRRAVRDVIARLQSGTLEPYRWA
jgi:hypothetical protein